MNKQQVSFVIFPHFVNNCIKGKQTKMTFSRM